MSESVTALVSLGALSVLAEPPPPVVLALAVEPFDVATVLTTAALLVLAPLAFVEVGDVVAGDVVAGLDGSLLEPPSHAIDSKPKVRSVGAWRTPFECIRTALHRITTDTRGWAFVRPARESRAFYWKLVKKSKMASLAKHGQPWFVPPL